MSVREAVLLRLGESSSVVCPSLVVERHVSLVEGVPGPSAQNQGLKSPKERES
jgi:hypothetical protein